ncbi:pyruvate dehydrogenase complex dihydrolipoyllysine-residue acetyltransferase [Flocculibacter collagenilyticus]|uniref:pyruvate dehydrogenase complex dihydrolipoyllysine-residue acetyltransferase n=1 Tax=Flocculibacter collagenilyticus TaxID=2744479 RepID=UPI0018F3F9BB|nr:pyruvate dehydrogenase complex dihydrolipoyllysine-residue acetyltransferase [Flocculibacter collagenilyticus]
MANLNEILVPDVGGDEVEVIELCVNVGDKVAAEDSLITVESDKASMDIPAPQAGTVKEIKVAVGDKVSEGSLIVMLEASADDSASEKSATESDSAKEAQASNQAAAESANTSSTQSSSNTSTTIEVTVPDIGTDGEVDVIDVLVSEGDSVNKEDGLITLETDKATMDVPCPESGVVKSLKVAAGDKVSQGSLVLILATEGGVGEQSAESSQSAAATNGQQESSTSGQEQVDQEPSGEAQVQAVEVPDIGTEGEVDIIDVLVAVGDTVEAEQGLITLETDKATMDVPSPFAGKVTEVKVSTGGKVAMGDVIVMIESASQSGGAKASQQNAEQSTGKSTEQASSQPQASKAQPSAQKAPPVPHHPSAGERQAGGLVNATPSVRRIAREFGVDLTKVKGTGRKGRILKEDVQAYVKYELSRPKATAASNVSASGGGLQVIAQPKVDFAKFGEVEKVALTRIQKISGPNLHRNWVTIPHVTQFDEADITDVEAFRKEQNALLAKQKADLKITPLVFIMKACANALLTYPVFNSSLDEDGEHLIMKKYVHIGIAVDTPNGLVVPVVRDVDKKGVNEISKELMEISKKARDGKLKAADMQGSCFTISSLGGIGGTAFTPIVNAPDVAILGVSKSEMKPKWDGAEFVPRLMLPLSLSYDHRVIDGAVAARFAVHVSSVLSDIRKLVL